MKKLIAVLLAILILSGTFAFAESVDLSAMTNDEVMQLYNDVKAEMSKRNLSVTLNLRDGKYIIGQDIEAGTYKLTCTGTEGESLSDAYSSLGDAYSSLLGDEWGQLMGAAGGLMGSVSEMEVKILGDYGDVLRSVEMKTGDVVTLTLNEGTALQISEGSCTLEMN